MSQNIFTDAKVYGEGWELIEERNFTSEELTVIIGGKVVVSKYGASIKFNRVGGGVFYFPLSRDSNLTVGEVVNLRTIKIQTLESDDDTIVRIK